MQNSHVIITQLRKLVVPPLLRLPPLCLRAGQRSYVELLRGRRESLGTRLSEGCSRSVYRSVRDRSVGDRSVGRGSVGRGSVGRGSVGRGSVGRGSVGRSVGRSVGLCLCVSVLTFSLKPWLL